ncbi:MAG: PH domain-containing protein [Armatimonadota bacterium]
MKYEFRATWDKWVWVISIFYVAIFGLVPVGMISYAMTVPGANRNSLIMVAVIMLAILAFTYLFAPQAYAVEPGHLIIQRPGTDVVIPLGTIARMEVADGWPIFRNAFRRFASGGALGFFGSFWNSTLNGFTAYATRLDKVVVLYRTDGGPIVVSPDEMEQFIAAMREAKRWR